MIELAPYQTKQSEAAFLRHLRKQRAELNERNPGLMKRLRKLSDADLEMLELAFLKLSPPSPTTNYQIRMLEELAYYRANPRRIKRYRPKVQPAPVAASQANLNAVAAIGPPADLATRPAALTGPAEGVAKPTDTTTPSNVIPLYGKAFHAGRVLGSGRRWIGGETPKLPGGR